MDVFLNSYGSAIVQMTIAAVLALSLYVPLMAGQLSLASPGFYAVGGYIAAVFSTQIFPKVDGLFPVPLVLVEMLVAAVVCAILAIIVGVPALRLRGIYLALATIAFIEVLRIWFLNQPILGGAVGIYNIPQPFDSPNRLDYLWLTLPLLLGSMFFVARLERSRVGRAFIALREDELAASAMGINPTYYKVLAFVIGAILAGMAGTVAAHLLNTWNARQGTFDLSIQILAYVLVGGSRTFLGPVIGGIFLTALPEVILREAASLPGLAPALVTFFKDGRLIIFGVLIAVSVFFFPYGLISPELWTRRRKQETVSPEAAANKPKSSEVRA